MQLVLLKNLAKYRATSALYIMTRKTGNPKIASTSCDSAQIFASLRKHKAGTDTMRSSSLILLLWFLLLHQVGGFPRGGGRGGGGRGGRGGRGGGGGYGGGFAIFSTSGPEFRAPPNWRIVPGSWSYTTRSGSRRSWRWVSVAI